MSRKSSVQLLLTSRALRDLEAIYDYSVERWGKRVADRYLDDLQQALDRLQAKPNLLRSEEDFHPAFRFYLVNKHVLACDVAPGSIVVLAILHASMDIPSRLAKLQPMLAEEVEMLHRRLRKK